MKSRNPWPEQNKGLKRWLQWQDLHGECGDVELRHQDIGHQLAFGFNR